MHSRSPRMIILTGERGSGRTSLINAISSQTDNRFVGTYWHSEDPLNCALDELAITFCGHEMPPSMHQKIERVVETLDSLSGPLPLVALDYPSHVDINSFLSLILPVLQRLRALVVVSISNSQMTSLDENTKEVFDEVLVVEPLSAEQIQLLSDRRIRKMSPEKWHINGNLLEAIISRTGGNARSVIATLRDLVDEGRGLGSKGTLESLISWNSQKISDMVEQEQEYGHQPPSTTLFEESLEESSEEIDNSIGDSQEYASPSHPPKPLFDESSEKSPGEIGVDWHELEEQELGDEDGNEDWGVGTDEMWPKQEAKPQLSDLDEELDTTTRDEKTSSQGSEKITGWSVDEGTILTMDEGTEPPRRNSNKGFSGLVSRSRITNDEMPTGPDYSVPIQEPVVEEMNVPSNFEPVEPAPLENPLVEPKENFPTRKPSFEEKKVLFSEGELWTVDSDLQETLPEIPNELEFESNEAIEEIETVAELKIPEHFTNKQKTTILGVPIWESKEIVNQNHLGRMSDAERLVVSIASSREISPSDAEIQARLEVGRPRLSQIYNSLHKSGILAVRKEGRSRLFKLSDNAVNLLSEV